MKQFVLSLLRRNQIILPALLVFFSFITTSQAQVKENFDDGNITNGPQWSGETTKYIIENSMLRLKDTLKTGFAYIVTENYAIENAHWEIDFDLKFNPSSSNYFDFILIADSPNLDENFDGYFVRVGRSTDDISLYVRRGNSVEVVIDGLDDRVDNSSVAGKIKVLRDDIGNWELLSDIEHQGIFSSEGSGFSDDFVNGGWSGIACKFTSTRADKFYFDNIEICGNPFTDKISPFLTQTHVQDGNRISLQFSENIYANIETTSFRLFPRDIFPTTTLLDQNIVELYFSKEFENGVLQSLSITEVSDLSNNPIEDTVIYFRFIQPRLTKKGDVQINEILADPDPQIGLPASEFVELYNTTSEPIDLVHWTICDDRSCGVFLDGFISKNGYVTLVPENESSNFGQRTNAIPIKSWPGINNSGETLRIFNQDGILIDSVNFRLNWLNADKRSGGWSLERKDPKYKCNNELNWTASQDENGGTPGYVNSVAEHIDDRIGPHIVDVWYDSLQGLFLNINEQFVTGEFHFISEPELWQDPVISQFGNTLTINGGNAPEWGVLYSIGVMGLIDCSGNESIGNERIEIARTRIAQRGELAINEILADPPPNGVDFIELINNSEDYLDVYDYGIANSGSNGIGSVRKVSKTHRIIGPDEIIALSSSSDRLKDQYPGIDPNRLIELTLPAYSNEEGTVVILYDSLVLDSVHYFEDWHFSLLDDTEGISLERISLILDSNDESNWNSASSNAGFGTPGMINSQVFSSAGNERISVVPKVIVPGNQGSHDVAKIEYELGAGAWMTSVSVFSFKGLKVKSLSNNSWTNDKGLHFWDGIMDNGKKAPIGIYLVKIEAFNDKGEVVTLRGKIYIGSYF